MESVVIRATIKYNELKEIYNSCPLQPKQIVAIKVLFIVLNVDL